MKHLILPAILVLLTFLTINAQTDKGTVLLGGGMAYTTSDGTGTFIATPNVGLFVIDNAAVIGKVSVLAQKGNTAWAVGPSVRLYLLDSDFGKIIGQLGINVGGATDSSTKVGFEIGGGYALFLNESIAVEGLANYIRAGDQGIFAISVGFQIHYTRG